jgi:predicted permease
MSKRKLDALVMGWAFCVLLAMLGWFIVPFVIDQTVTYTVTVPGPATWAAALVATFGTAGFLAPFVALIAMQLTGKLPRKEN